MVVLATNQPRHIPLPTNITSDENHQKSRTMAEPSVVALRTDILTEHLGYAPIGLIDDIINAVNDILYKCTAALETFLNKKYAPGSSRAKKYRIPPNEIQLGTAKLETLLESVVDRSFDKFELYVLRNILTIPSDLISEGWVRLEHHEHVDFQNTLSLADLDRQIIEAEQMLVNERIRNLIFKKLSTTSAQESEKSEEYNQALHFLAHNSSSNDELRESFIFLASQVSVITNMIKSMEDSNGDLVLKESQASDRDQYIDEFVKRAIKKSGIKPSFVSSASHDAVPQPLINFLA